MAIDLETISYRASATSELLAISLFWGRKVSTGIVWQERQVEVQFLVKQLELNLNGNEELALAA